MNETMPISAGLPAGMTTDACLEAQLRSAFLTGETDGEEAGLRPEFVINDPDRRIKVLTVIEDELARCTSFDISVAFVTMSGIEPLLPIFEELRERGVPGRVLTTDYLCFSDPAAMRKLAGISNIEVRLFRAEGNRGFPTKGYIFKSGDVCRFLIGIGALSCLGLCLRSRLRRGCLAGCTAAAGSKQYGHRNRRCTYNCFFVFSHVFLLV